MRNVLNKLWADDAGWIISVEMILIFTIISLGLIVGLTSLRNAIVSELIEVSNAITVLDQSYGFVGITGCNVNNFTNGSHATDTAHTVSYTVTPVTALSIDVIPCP
jgi:Flp pilus assembly pilin Flp